MATVKGNSIDVEIPEARVVQKRKLWTIVGVCVAIAVVVIIVVVLVVLLTRKDASTQQGGGRKYELCEDSKCKALSQEIAQSMDKSVDPCKNFYQYACGGWEKNHPLNGKGSLTVMGIMTDENINDVKKGLEQAASKYPQNEAVMKTVRFYTSCLNTTSLKFRALAPMKNLIERYGGWSVSDNYNSSVTTATRIAKAARELNVPTLLNMRAESDVYDSKAIILTLLPAALTKTAFSHETEYKQYMKDAGKLFAGSDTDTKMMAIFDFEKKLYEIGGDASYGDSSIKERHKRTKRNAQFQDDRISTTKFCTDSGFSCPLLKDVLGIIYGRNFTGDEKLSNPDVAYFQNLKNLYDATSQTVIADYIMWRVVQQYISALAPDYAELKDVFLQAPRQERWKTCVDVMMKGFVFTIGLIYIDQAKFEDKAKKAVEDMTNDVKAAFIARLPSQTWMDAATQNTAKEKALAVALDIGYPPIVRDNAKLKQEYQMVQVTDDYFDNFVSMNHYMRMREIIKYGKPNDKSVWDSGNPAEVNGIYDSSRNSIVYFAGIIQPPLYNKEYPSYMNYGAIGAVIGHELTHGFDGQGRKYDKKGEFVNWWSNSAAQSFEEKAQCLVNQYNQYSMFDTNLNGTQTLDENIADNGGIKISYDAYQRWAAQNGTEKILPELDLNPDQLFFLGYAQIWCGVYTADEAKYSIKTGQHTIDKYRVIGTLSNFDKFSEAYKCPSGSAMNPSKKCAIW